MIVDQATALRSMVDGSAPASVEVPSSVRVIAVTSGKGGVGKTNLTVNLAAELSRRGYRTLVLDGDLGLANADVVAGVQAKANMAHVLAGRCSLQQVLVNCPGGFDLVPGASGLAQMADLDESARRRMLQMLNGIDRQYQFMLIDTGAGLSRTVLGFLSATEEILLITTPEPTAMTDAYAMIKVLARRRPNVHVQLVVNQVCRLSEGLEVYRRLNKVAERFLNHSVIDAGAVLHDQVVGQSVRQRQPFIIAHPRSAASVSIRRLADYLSDRPPADTGRRLIERVLGWFSPSLAGGSRS